MSFWLISVPARAGSPALVSEVQAAAGSALTSGVHQFGLPELKVGTLDQLMALSEDTTKMDTFVGGVAKKIEKTYYEMWKTEAQELAAAKERSAAAAGGQASSSSSSAQIKEDKAPELRIGDQNKTAHEYVTRWQWNDVRYPRRSPLRTLAELIMKEASKADEALRKQLAEYADVRTQHTAIERRDQGTLLVKPIGPYVTKEPLETQHLTTLMIVVPRARKQEFIDSYETLEQQAAEREAAEQQKKAAEAEERARKEAERKAAEEAASPSAASAGAKAAHESERAREKALEAEKVAEAQKLEAQMEDPAARARKEAAQKEKEEEEKRKNKKLPKGLNAVVPRSATILCDQPTDEFVLFSIVVLRQGAEVYKNLCREKRYTVRPFKFDPAEDKAERERKEQLASKKKKLWNFLIRWCTTSYTEIFSAWIHLKAVRLYVETVLRYGLPFAAQAALIEPARGKDRQLRDVLKNLYGVRLAGNNAALATQLDPNETDISGLGADFFPYVYLPLNISD